MLEFREPLKQSLLDLAANDTVGEPSFGNGCGG
jgi:hypothetical protein